MKFDYGTVKSILEAVQRRLELFYSLVDDVSKEVMDDYRVDMHEGVVVTLIKLSGDDWPEVRTMLDKAELELNFWD